MFGCVKLLVRLFCVCMSFLMLKLRWLSCGVLMMKCSWLLGVLKLLCRLMWLLVIDRFVLFGRMCELVSCMMLVLVSGMLLYRLLVSLKVVFVEICGVNVFDVVSVFDMCVLLCLVGVLVVFVGVLLLFVFGVFIVVSSSGLNVVSVVFVL